VRHYPAVGIFDLCLVSADGAEERNTFMVLENFTGLAVEAEVAAAGLLV
jgi:hypothetical protein